MLIVELLATMGGGKSILMAFLGLLAFEDNEPVYANFKISDFSLPFDTINDIKKCTWGKAFIDDIISWLDSRQSMSNFKTSWLYTQSRKRAEGKPFDIIYSSQVDTGADYRLRAVTNGVIKPSIIEFPFFNLEFYSVEGEYIDSKVIEYGSDVVDLYDTYEIIEQKVSLNKLIELRNRCDKSTFSQIAGLRYSFTLELGKNIYTLLGNNDIDLVSELLEGNGYKLILEIEA